MKSFCFAYSLFIDNATEETVSKERLYNDFMKVCADPISLDKLQQEAEDNRKQGAEDFTLFDVWIISQIIEGRLIEI